MNDPKNEVARLKTHLALETERADKAKGERAAYRARTEHAETVAEEADAGRIAMEQHLDGLRKMLWESDNAKDKADAAAKAGAELLTLAAADLDDALERVEKAEARQARAEEVLEEWRRAGAAQLVDIVAERDTALAEVARSEEDLRRVEEDGECLHCGDQKTLRAEVELLKTERDAVSAEMVNAAAACDEARNELAAMRVENAGLRMTLADVREQHRDEQLTGQVGR